ncbi:MAG TPA: MBL fold metallo-hydrolase, partial [Gemmatimonadales bacterium]|nr:MBL fold metallo-hydrolase [Gemmatimonadales bacterium]
IGQSGGVDLAILPIGAYDPWIGNHANPEQAWTMAGHLGARQVLPVHHSTFRLSREPREEPLKRLLAATGDQRDRVVGRGIGETITIED